MRVCLLLAALLLVWPLQAAERVVSLAPSLTDIMLELGAADRLVGVLDGGERPAQLAHLPSLGRLGQLELETLVSLRPDLVLLWPDSIGPAQRQQLQRLGIPVHVGEPRRLHELAEEFVLIGQAVGYAQQGAALSQRFREGVARLRQHYAGRPPVRVFYQIWHQPLYTIGGRQIISDAIALCGGQNVFADLELPAPQVGLEAIIARDPQLIIAGSNAELGIWQAWPQLSAVRHQQLWPVPSKRLERPSFQMLAATEQLCELIDGARQGGAD